MGGRNRPYSQYTCWLQSLLFAMHYYANSKRLWRYSLLKVPYKVHQAESPGYRIGTMCNVHTLLSVHGGIENGIQKRVKE
jgi:hypothetical protein